MGPIRSILAVICCAAIAVGCSQRIGDFTLISTKNVEIGGKYKKAERMRGEDKAFYFLFPFGTPNLKNAVDKCIEAGGGELLTNAVINSSAPFLVGSFGFEVVGDVWVKATMGDLYDPDIELYELKLTSNGFELWSLKDENKHIQVTYILE
jgi:hypothetical protein